MFVSALIISGFCKSSKILILACDVAYCSSILSFCALNSVDCQLAIFSFSISALSFLDDLVLDDLELEDFHEDLLDFFDFTLAFPFNSASLSCSVSLIRL